MKPHILVITSTVRQNRMGRKVADWYMAEAKKAAPDATFELLDIADLDLALFNEPIDPLSAELSGKLTAQQQELAEPITKADGFVFVTSEYNHSIPGGLKNFIDYIAPGAWPRKAAAFVGYGAGDAWWGIMHLMQVMIYLRVMSMISTIHINTIWEALGEDGKPKPEYMHGDVKKQLDELVWWAAALKAKREQEKGGQ